VVIGGDLPGLGAVPQATGQERATFKGFRNSVWSVAYSPDGKTLASASGDSTVMLWDVATAR
jgi:WD40 repeat protein